MRRSFIVMLALCTMAFCACKGVGDGELGVKLIYMPQSTMYNGGITNEYPVPMSGLNVKNYTLSDEGQLTIPLGVYRSGQGSLESYSVEVAYDEAATQSALATISNAVILPTEYFTVPASVSVPDGRRDATFHVNVDIAAVADAFPDYYKNKIIAAFTISNPSRYELNPSLCTAVVSIDGKTFISAPPTPPEPEAENLVKCGDFEDSPETYWTIKDVNGDAEKVMQIKNGHLEIERSGACPDNFRWNCFQKLEAPLEEGKWYKMSVKISVPVPVTWYSRGIDLGFYVSGIDPAPLNDYKANKDVLFFVDTDMESARKDVGPLHGTDGFVNFPTVCTYCNPADIKVNGGKFQAVKNMQWVGFYLRERNTLLEMNKIIFDDVEIRETTEP